MLTRAAGPLLAKPASWARATSRSPPAAIPRSARFAVEGVVAQGITDQRQRERRDYLHQLDTLGERAARRRRRSPASRRGGAAGVRTDPGRRRQGLRPLAGEGRAARPLRPQHVRAIVPGGAAAGGARRPVHHDQLQAAGTRTSRISRPCGSGCPRWTRAWRRCSQDLSRARPARLHDRLVERRVRPHAEGACGKRRGTAGAAIGARSSAHWSRAADSRAARWSAPRDARGEEVKDRPVYPADLIGSIYDLLGIDTDGEAAAPERLRRRECSPRTRRREIGRAGSRRSCERARVFLIVSPRPLRAAADRAARGLRLSGGRTAGHDFEVIVGGQALDGVRNASRVSARACRRC